jgi:hypothetical protein
LHGKTYCIRQTNEGIRPPAPGTGKAYSRESFPSPPPPRPQRCPLSLTRFYRRLQFPTRRNHGAPASGYRGMGPCCSSSPAPSPSSSLPQRKEAGLPSPPLDAPPRWRRRSCSDRGGPVVDPSSSPGAGELAAQIEEAPALAPPSG